MKTFDSSGTRLIEEKHTGKCVNAGYQLMLRASSCAAAVIRTVLDTYSRAVVLAGKGNNGGDALCVASLLYNSGFRNIVIYSVCGKEQYSGEAAMAVRDLAPEIPFLTPDELFPEDFMCGDIVVDGLLGIGFSGTEVRGRAASFIRAGIEAESSCDKSRCSIRSRCLGRKSRRALHICRRDADVRNCEIRSHDVSAIQR